ncbi:MAG: glycosyltransferase family 1 protein [Promethearchaeota archaeon]|nr:MAG: glycosyltransferase family 1 protein [Candidatus Lokiarchaeota archaeon]
MQISHVVQRYYPAISGSELYMQRISELLNKRHEIKVACSNALDFYSFWDPNGKKVDERISKVKNIPIYRFPIKYRYFINKFPLFEYKEIKNALKKITRFRVPLLDIYNILINGPYCPDLLRFLLNSKQDIIHSTCFPFSINLFAVLAGKMKGIPTLTTPFFHFSNPRYHDLSLLRFLRFFDKILTCSDLESKFIMKYSGVRNIENKIERIKMGVDLEIFKKARPKQFRRKFKVWSKPMVLFCGYKNYEKGAISLLKSIKYTVKVIPDIIYVFIGPSTKGFNITKKSLSKSLRAHILNFGVVPYDNLKVKINAFAAADIYAMPSRSDAYGIAFLEAFACKKPVIGANIGATPEVIRDGVDGLLLPFDRPKILAQKIIILLKDSKLRHEMGENGYERVKNQSWEHISKRIEQIYLSLYD